MNNGSKVLIVDDERNMRTTLSRILTAAGHSATVADSGEKAVEICESAEFDVVLMDVRMTGMNGVDAFRTIRKSRPACRFILMSAYAVDDLRRAALAEGVSAFLRKPVNIQQMLSLVAGGNGAPDAVAG